MCSPYGGDHQKNNSDLNKFEKCPILIKKKTETLRLTMNFTKILMIFEMYDNHLCRFTGL